MVFPITNEIHCTKDYILEIPEKAYGSIAWIRVPHVLVDGALFTMNQPDFTTAMLIDRTTLFSKNIHKGEVYEVNYRCKFNQQ